MSINFRSIAFVCCCCFALPAWALSPAEFLKSMEGTWRGKGTMYVSKEAKTAPVRCKITSTFDETKRQVRNKGRCATTQRKVKISGALGYSKSGNTVSGSFINSTGDLEITKSSGSIKGNTLTLNTTYWNKAVSKITRFRNVITRLSDRKSIVTIYEKDGGSFKQRGKITLTK